jgi:hypothetical protein
VEYTSYSVRLSFPDPSLGPKEQLGSWTYSILPFLEQEAAYAKIDFGASQPLYACPTRRTGAAQVCPAHDPVNRGITYDTAGINPWSKTDYNANGLIIQCFPHPLARLSDITDGTATALLVG